MNPIARAICLTAFLLATTITLTVRIVPRHPRAPSVPPPTSVDIDSACQERAAELRSQSGGRLTTLVRVPWVLAGNATDAELQTTYEAQVEPAWCAMAHDYFCKVPDRPITLLLLTTETAYRYWAEQLFFDRGVSRFGYYKPGRRTVVVNLAEGTGGLFHEMTHALMAFDFPNAPCWFEEGLASLHEAACLETSADWPSLKGRVNWRLEVLNRSMHNGRSLRLQSLLKTRDMSGRDEAVRYAEARYFCLFLQEQHLLTTYYQRLRCRGSHDPTGERTLRETLPDASWQALDARFLQWLSSLAQRGPTCKFGVAGVHWRALEMPRASTVQHGATRRLTAREGCCVYLSPRSRSCSGSQSLAASYRVVATCPRLDCWHCS